MHPSLAWLEILIIFVCDLSVLTVVVLLRDMQILTGIMTPHIAPVPGELGPMSKMIFNWVTVLAIPYNGLE